MFRTSKPASKQVVLTTVASPGAGPSHQRWSSEPSPPAHTSICGQLQQQATNVTLEDTKNRTIKQGNDMSTAPAATGPSGIAGNSQFRTKPVAFHRQLFAQLQNAVKTATGRNRKQQQQTCSLDVSSGQPTAGNSKVACSLDRAVLKNRKQKNDSRHDRVTTKSSLPLLIDSGLDVVNYAVTRSNDYTSVVTTVTEQNSAVSAGFGRLSPSARGSATIQTSWEYSPGDHTESDQEPERYVGVSSIRSNNTESTASRVSGTVGFSTAIPEVDEWSSPPATISWLVPAVPLPEQPRRHSMCVTDVGRRQNKPFLDGNRYPQQIGCDRFFPLPSTQATTSSSDELGRSRTFGSAVSAGTRNAGGSKCRSTAVTSTSITYDVTGRNSRPVYENLLNQARGQKQESPNANALNGVSGTSGRCSRTVGSPSSSTTRSTIAISPSRDTRTPTQQSMRHNKVSGFQYVGEEESEQSYSPMTVVRRPKLREDPNAVKDRRSVISTASSDSVEVTFQSANNTSYYSIRNQSLMNDSIGDRTITRTSPLYENSFVQQPNRTLHHSLLQLMDNVDECSDNRQQQSFVLPDNNSRQLQSKFAYENCSFLDVSAAVVPCQSSTSVVFGSPLAPKALTYDTSCMEDFTPLQPNAGGALDEFDWDDRLSTLSLGCRRRNNKPNNQFESIAKPDVINDAIVSNVPEREAGNAANTLKMTDDDDDVISVCVDDFVASEAHEGETCLEIGNHVTKSNLEKTRRCRRLLFGTSSNPSDRTVQSVDDSLSAVDRRLLERRLRAPITNRKLDSPDSVLSFNAWKQFRPFSAVTSSDPEPLYESIGDVAAVFDAARNMANATDYVTAEHIYHNIGKMAGMSKAETFPAPPPPPPRAVAECRKPTLMTSSSLYELPICPTDIVDLDSDHVYTIADVLASFRALAAHLPRAERFIAELQTSAMAAAAVERQRDRRQHPEGSMTSEQFARQPGRRPLHVPSTFSEVSPRSKSTGIHLTGLNFDQETLDRRKRVANDVSSHEITNFRSRSASVGNRSEETSTNFSRAAAFRRSTKINQHSSNVAPVTAGCRAVIDRKFQQQQTREVASSGDRLVCSPVKQRRLSMLSTSVHGPLAPDATVSNPALRRDQQRYENYYGGEAAVSGFNDHTNAGIKQRSGSAADTKPHSRPANYRPPVHCNTSHCVAADDLEDDKENFSFVRGATSQTRCSKKYGPAVSAAQKFRTGSGNQAPKSAQAKSDTELGSPVTEGFVRRRRKPFTQNQSINVSHLTKTGTESENSRKLIVSASGKYCTKSRGVVPPAAKSRAVMTSSLHSSPSSRPSTVFTKRGSTSLVEVDVIGDAITGTVVNENRGKSLAKKGGFLDHTLTTSGYDNDNPDGSHPKLLRPNSTQSNATVSDARGGVGHSVEGRSFYTGTESQRTSALQTSNEGCQNNNNNNVKITERLRWNKDTNSAFSHEIFC